MFTALSSSWHCVAKVHSDHLNECRSAIDDCQLTRWPSCKLDLWIRRQDATAHRSGAQIKIHQKFYCMRLPISRPKWIGATFNPKCRLLVTTFSKLATKTLPVHLRQTRVGHGQGLDQSMDWIDWIGSGFSGNFMDWNGWDDCDPVLISNHCSIAVSSNYDLWTFNYPR